MILPLCIHLSYMDIEGNEKYIKLINIRQWSISLIQSYLSISDYFLWGLSMIFTWFQFYFTCLIFSVSAWYLCKSIKWYNSVIESCSHYIGPWHTMTYVSAPDLFDYIVTKRIWKCIGHSSIMEGSSICKTFTAKPGLKILSIIYEHKI
jgi:hypothetical protein